MVIGHEYRYLFVEVPHTGSHSISAELVNHYGGATMLRKHANLSQFWHQASRDERRYFKFATIRNPLDTTVTEYFKYKSNHKGQYSNPDHFIEHGGHVTSEHRKHFRFVHEEGADFPAFFRRFKSSIYNNWFLLGYDNLDFVIRFDNLQDDYLQALRMIGVEQARALPHVNPTKGKRDYREFYTPDIQQLAIECYGPFFKKWGFEFHESWVKAPVPFATRVKFHLKDWAVNTAAKVMMLDPDAPHVKRLKAAIDSVI